MEAVNPVSRGSEGSRPLIPAPEADAWAFEVEGLVARYAGRQVLRVDKLTCPSVGTTVLVGPSGCGKSTLLKILANLADRDLTHRGRVCDFGVARDPDDEEAPSVASVRRHAMVWQTPILFPCSPLENLSLPLKKRRVPKSRWRADIVSD